MANSTGKAARRRLGTRYSCKRHVKHNNPTKKARWLAMEKERTRRKKGDFEQ